MNFNPGSVVRLKSGGPEMVVLKVDEDGVVVGLATEHGLWGDTVPAVGLEVVGGPTVGFVCDPADAERWRADSLILTGLREGLAGTSPAEETCKEIERGRAEGARLRRIARMDLEGFRAGVLGETYGDGSHPDFVRGYEEGRQRRGYEEGRKAAATDKARAAFLRKVALTAGKRARRLTSEEGSRALFAFAEWLLAETGIPDPAKSLDVALGVGDDTAPVSSTNTVAVGDRTVTTFTAPRSWEKPPGPVTRWESTEREPRVFHGCKDHDFFAYTFTLDEPAEVGVRVVARVGDGGGPLTLAVAVDGIVGSEQKYEGPGVYDHLRPTHYRLDAGRHIVEMRATGFGRVEERQITVLRIPEPTADTEDDTCAECGHPLPLSDAEITQLRALLAREGE